MWLGWDSTFSNVNPLQQSWIPSQPSSRGQLQSNLLPSLLLQRQLQSNLRPPLPMSPIYPYVRFITSTAKSLMGPPWIVVGFAWARLQKTWKALTRCYHRGVAGEQRKWTVSINFCMSYLSLKLGIGQKISYNFPHLHSINCTAYLKIILTLHLLLPRDAS